MDNQSGERKINSSKVRDRSSAALSSSQIGNVLHDYGELGVVPMRSGRQAVRLTKNEEEGVEFFVLSSCYPLATHGRWGWMTARLTPEIAQKLASCLREVVGK
jgi:hypothetical protein